MARLTRPALVATAGTWDLRAWLDDVYLTLHVAAMGFTLVLPLLGAAMSATGIDAAGIAWRLAIALSFHVFAYALNDVCDLSIDRTEPQRADDPLVRGAISRGAVFSLAMLQLPILASLWRIGGAAGRTGVLLAAAIIALAAYDRWGKSLGWPIVTDLVQGLGWAALFLAGVADESAVTARVVWGAVAIVVYILLVNGIVGPLRDLTNDHAAGARTTALLLGVRPDRDGLHVPRRFAAYGLALHIGYLGTLAPLLATTAWPARGVVGGLALVASSIALVVVPRAIGSPGALARAGGAYIAASLGALVTVGAANAGSALALSLFLAFSIPVGLMFVRNRSRWS